MTDLEIRPFVGRPVRLNLADGRILAGRLHRQADTDIDSEVYLVVSDPAAEDGVPVQEPVANARLITEIEDASNDPAAA